MVIYNPSIPTAGEFPSFSQPLILGNFTYLQAFGDKDHQFTLDSSNQVDGTHKQVTLTEENSPALPLGTDCVIYAHTDGALSQLFFHNDGGIDAQLTSFKAGVPNSAASGVTSLPGGMLMQWDTVSASTNDDITFPVPFSAVPYVVIPTIFGSNSAFHVQPKSSTMNDWKVNTWTASGATTSGPLNVSYVAIGPA